MKKDIAKKGHWFESFSTAATRATGSTGAFLIACGVVIGWAICGPIFNFSEIWQMAINTGTTIVTFLMIFLIQKTQNKDGIAIQIKLNELVAASAEASNRIVSIEDLTEEELIRLNEYYTRLAQLTQSRGNLKLSNSIEDLDIKKEKKQIVRKINEIADDPEKGNHRKGKNKK